MPSIFLSFLICYSTYLSVVTIELSQAHPMKGVNVRDATSSDNLTFVVSLGHINRGGEHFCTGSLITRRSVLTCQHCIYGEEKSNVQITIGSTNLQLGLKYRVASWRSFDQWYYQVKELAADTDDDIAIVRLDGRVDDPNIKPVSILYAGVPNHLENVRLRMAGWGLVDDDTKTMILKTGLVQPIPMEECLERGKNITGDELFELPRHHFCSLAYPWLLAHCGDSGGPTLNENNQLIAVTTGVCPIALFIYGVSVDFRDSNLVNTHLNLLEYKKFIETAAIL